MFSIIFIKNKDDRSKFTPFVLSFLFAIQLCVIVLMTNKIQGVNLRKKCIIPWTSKVLKVEEQREVQRKFTVILQG